MKSFPETTKTIKIQPTISSTTVESLDEHANFQRKGKLVVAKEWLTLLELIPPEDYLSIQGQILSTYTKTAFELKKP